MSILDNLFSQYIFILKEILSKLYIDQQVENIILQMEKEFTKLIDSELTKNVTLKDINQKTHIVTPCFMIALYRVLNGIPSITVSLELISDIMMDVF